MPRCFEVVRRVRERWRAVLGVSAVVVLVQALVAAPIAALLLKAFLAQTGKASIGNFEIVRFLLTPTGVGALLVLTALALFGTYVHVAALLRVLGEPALSVGAAIRSLPSKGHRLLRLGLLQVGCVLLLAAPLLVAMLLLVKGIWGGRDLNGLLVLRPPEFWWGIAAASVPALLLVILLVRLWLRWLLALPILVEQPETSPLAVLRASAHATRGRHARHLRALAGWALLAAGLGALASALVAGAGGWLLERVGPRMAVALPATGLVLVLWVAASTFTTWLSLGLYAALIDRLHRDAFGRPPATALPAVESSGSRMRAAVLGLAALAGLALLGGWWLLRTQPVSDGIEITAHRMGAIAAPENTLAALRQAIVESAEWAELDVQLTSDGALVVLHDFDLVRIGGPAKQVARATLAEIRAIDVGAGLRMPAFAGERVPTLDEVIAAAGDAIRLNIELKPPTPAADAPLADAVLAAIRKADLVARCRVCSQSHAAMRRMKESAPGLTVGWIAGAAVGDLAAVQVDFLMLRAPMATRRLVREAHARGMQIHPWTVNDPDALLALLDRGVDNVITDVPAAMRARLDEVRGLSPPERLLLRVRNLLAD
jgi:glycerophosphoryl diester phosphodiesterase